MKHIEILAPAGSWDTMCAALNAGCDAVYAGGNRFGARAFANNFTEEEMCQAIDRMHRYGKKLYMTVNTLFYEQELQEELYDYMKPYVEHGLDGCIVQDVGVIKYLHTAFPTLPLHASTQLTLMSGNAAELFRQYGVVRYVPARELSISELKACREQSSMDMEVFVHGALCYCYSGQCLMSSVIGGRSGNRGQCAQPCRVQYMCEGKTGYFLSPRDLCTLEHVEELVEAGIDSFKIEGRMKGSAYAAYTSRTYRQAVDEVQKGETIEKTEKWIHDCQDIYNRGGFCGGFLFESNQKERMIYPKKNNHYGLEVGYTIKKSHHQASFLCTKEVNAQDVLEFRDERGTQIYEFTLKEGSCEGSIVTTNILPGSPIEKDMKVYRTRNNKLLHEIELISDAKVPIVFELTAKIGEPITLKMIGVNQDITITCQGVVVEEAGNRPTRKEDIEQKLSGLGTTDYELTDLRCEVDDNCFIPLGKVKELRRNAIGIWEQAVREQYRGEVGQRPQKIQTKWSIEESWVVVVSNLSQITDGILPNIRTEDVRIGLRYDAFTSEEREEAKQLLKERKLSCVYVIYRWDDLLCVQKQKEIPYIMGANMYAVNSWACSVYEDLGASAVSAPWDASEELRKDCDARGEYITVYGYIPLMVTKNCVRRTLGKCSNGKNMEPLVLKNERQDEFLVVNSCENCYNTIYTSEPMEWKEEYKHRCLMFTIETADEVGRVIQKWKI